MQNTQRERQTLDVKLAIHLTFIYILISYL